MSDRDELDRDVLEAWKAEEPPAGFVDRVMAARAGAASTAREPVRATAGRWRYAVAAAALVAVAASVLYVSTRPRVRWVAEGSVVTVERQTVSLGGRGVAVVEADSEISFTVDRDGVTRVAQPRGDVFYRVDRGGAFVVATPAGEVRVTGTCFRVEVSPMRPSKQSVVGAAVGAALASTVFVTVYEGRVLLANDKGEQHAVAAGERARMTGAGGPIEVGGAVAQVEPPSATATREELLERDRVQRDELARLRVQVRELAAGAGGEAIVMKRGPGRRGGPDTPFVDPTAEDLMALARECAVQYDSPPLSSEREISPEMAEERGITEDERRKLNEAMKAFRADVTRRLRELYVEVTGDMASAELLAVDALWREIQDKSDEKDLEEAMWRISQERAGLLAPPADLASRPAVERGARMMADLGNEFEKVLAKVLGAERAHELRKIDDGFPERHMTRGCPEDKPSLAPAADNANPAVPR